MISARNRLLGPAAAVLSLGLLAACSSDSDSGASSDVGTNALDGVEVTVGSKNFTENILLGQMIAQAMEVEGASVTDQTNLGGTSVNREALLNGEIDVYPDYNGTGWTVHLGQDDPTNDPQVLYDQVAEMDLAENGIQWSGLSPFNDTYGFAANAELAAAEGTFDMQGMADYLAANPDTVVCMESEFPDRPDGLVLFEDATGYEVPTSQQQILETGLVYTETANGACDFGEVYTTDGRIPALNLSVVEDPGVMILYNLSFTWDDDKYQENAETYQRLADEILAPLDQAKMAELNAQVDVEGEKAEDVASEYLQEIGLK